MYGWEVLNSVILSEPPAKLYPLLLLWLYKLPPAVLQVSLLPVTPVVTLGTSLMCVGVPRGLKAEAEVVPNQGTLTRPSSMTSKLKKKRMNWFCQFKYLMSVNTGSSKAIEVDLTINGKQVRMELDTGPTVQTEAIPAPY